MSPLDINLSSCQRQPRLGCLFFYFPLWGSVSLLQEPARSYHVLKVSLFNSQKVALSAIFYFMQGVTNNPKIKTKTYIVAACRCVLLKSPTVKKSFCFSLPMSLCITARASPKMSNGYISFLVFTYILNIYLARTNLFL